MDNSEIKKSVLSFPVEFEKIEEVESTDERFTRVKIWLMHTGKNLNGSEFEKTVVDKAIPTLQYVPVVGFIEDNDKNEKDFSDHRYIITKDEKGLRRKYMGNAYGVILSSEDNNAHYEERLCDDGETREFLVVDGILWNMFEDSSDIMNQDIVKGQSMELFDKSVEGYEDEDGIFHFTKFSFRAACILGDGYTPAMTGSTVEVQFTMNDFVKNIQSELNDKYNTFTKIVNDTTFTKTVKKKNNQGGNKSMPNIDFTQTALECFADISNIVSQYESVKDRWNDDVPRYYLHDVQDNEVIVVDRSNNYQYYGYPLSFEGDKPVIDFACGGKRKKTRYVDYEEGVPTPVGGFEFGKFISEAENIAFTKIEEANAKVEEAENKVAEFELKITELEEAKNTAETNYTEIKAQYDEMKPKYDDFVESEQARIAAELESQKDAEFAKYETALADCLEFEELKSKKADMTVKEIEGECAVLYARKNLANTNFTKSNTGGMTAGIINNDNDTDGYVMTKYGNIPVRQ